MSDNIKRQKIMEREQFTYDEKRRFAKKSDDKCCHCGKKVFFGYGATVEHFIPLSQGGTNREINMVMLCKECNSNKGNFIYYPSDYLTYIKPEYLEQIQGYFDSYIQSFDFINRDNLLACDRYKVEVSMAPDDVYFSMLRKAKKKKNMNIMSRQSVSMWVKRATMDDLDRLTEYYIKYLKKYDCLDDEKAALVNIKFWLTFGCIYYIENKRGEIEAFITITVTKDKGYVRYKEKDVENFLTINVFAYYNTDRALTLAYNLSRQIPKSIITEQKLPYIPVKYNVLSDDSLSNYICGDGQIYLEDRFLSAFIILYSKKNNEEKVVDFNDKKLKKFFEKFRNLNNEYLDKWFLENNDETYRWMLREIDFTTPIDEED